MLGQTGAAFSHPPLSEDSDLKWRYHPEVTQPLLLSLGLQKQDSSKFPEGASPGCLPWSSAMPGTSAVLSQPWRRSNSLACALAKAPPGHSPRVPCLGIAQVQKCVVIACLPSKGLSCSQERPCAENIVQGGVAEGSVGQQIGIHTAQETLLFNTSLCSDLLLLTEIIVPSFQTLNFQCSQVIMLEPRPNWISHSMCNYKSISKRHPSSSAFVSKINHLQQEV